MLVGQPVSEMLYGFVRIWIGQVSALGKHWVFYMGMNERHETQFVYGAAGPRFEGPAHALCVATRAVSPRGQVDSCHQHSDLPAWRHKVRGVTKRIGVVTFERSIPCLLRLPRSVFCSLSHLLSHIRALSAVVSAPQCSQLSVARSCLLNLCILPALRASDRDRLSGLTANFSHNQPGWLRTHALVLEGHQLSLNAIVGYGGSIRVEVRSNG